MIRLLKKLSKLVSPGYYAELIGHKYGLWDWALNNRFRHYVLNFCLLYTSDAADE